MEGKKRFKACDCIIVIYFLLCLAGVLFRNKWNLYAEQNYVLWPKVILNYICYVGLYLSAAYAILRLLLGRSRVVFSKTRKTVLWCILAIAGAYYLFVFFVTLVAKIDLKFAYRTVTFVILNPTISLLPGMLLALNVSAEQ